MVVSVWYFPTASTSFSWFVNLNVGSSEGLGIGSRSFLRCCAFIFSGGSKTVSCLQSVATLGNQSNRVLNKVQAHLAGHLWWVSILTWCKPNASLCSEIPPLSWTIYQGSNTQERRGQGKQNQSGEHSSCSCKSWISCVIDTQALNYELNLYQSDTVKDKHMIVDPSQLNVRCLIGDGNSALHWLRCSFCVQTRAVKSYL